MLLFRGNRELLHRHVSYIKDPGPSAGREKGIDVEVLNIVFWGNIYFLCNHNTVPLWWWVLSMQRMCLQVEVVFWGETGGLKVRLIFISNCFFSKNNLFSKKDHFYCFRYRKCKSHKGSRKMEQINACLAGDVY